MAEITRLFDFPHYQLKKYNLDKALTTKYNGKWTSISSQEYVDKANAISRGLLRLGVQPNDKIAVISSTNRTEWNIMDIGILQTGAQNIPIYPTICAEDYEYVLNHSVAIYCFVSDYVVLQKVLKIKDKTSLKEVYSFNQIEGCKHYSELLELGKDTSNQNEVEARKNNVLPNDLATIIYTSGTTGKPKGVMLSHNNIVSNVLATRKLLPLSKGDKALSFLPVCHIFERTILYLYQYCGMEICFAESIEKVGANLNEVNPHIMTAVPRLYEKMYDKLYAKGEALSGVKKALYYWAIKLGLQFKPYDANGWWYGKKLAIARELIFSKWQDGFGGNLKLMVSGSAPLQTRLIKVFTAAGMPIMEGYGLTETSPVVSMNDQNNGGFRIGTIGKIIDKVEVKIADDDEILVKGPNVMLGYYKDPEKTAEVMTGDYFHTGDKGAIDADGFLRITGRKKEMFKTSGGKYVIPALLENELKQSLFIEQIMVVGESEKMPAAIIQPNFEYIKEWIDREEIDVEKDNAAIASSKIVIKTIQQEIKKCNEHFGKWEQIKRFELTPNVWNVADGHLTPTMKMKRDIIKGIYQDLYDKIYR